MEVYVDNLHVKREKPEQYLTDIHEAFVVLRRYQMKLNLSKCTLGVESRKFSGFKVSEKGIKALKRLK